MGRREQWARPRKPLRSKHWAEPWRTLAFALSYTPPLPSNEYVSATLGVGFAPWILAVHFSKEKSVLLCAV